MCGPTDQHSHLDRNVLDGSEREEEEEEVEENEQAKLEEEECVNSDQEYDTDLELRGIEKIDFEEKKGEINRIIVTFMIKGAMFCFVFSCKTCKALCVIC